MADPHHDDPSSSVVDDVDDPILTDPQSPVAFPLAPHPQGGGRTRVRAEGVDDGSNAAADTSQQAAKFPARRRLVLDPVRHRGSDFERAVDLFGGNSRFAFALPGDPTVVLFFLEERDARTQGHVTTATSNGTKESGAKGALDVRARPPEHGRRFVQRQPRARSDLAPPRASISGFTHDRGPKRSHELQPARGRRARPLHAEPGSPHHIEYPSTRPPEPTTGWAPAAP